MEYLSRVLGIKVVYQDDAPASMPNYIAARYRIHRVVLAGKSALFVYPKDALETVSAVRKHIDRIERVQGAPAVLVLDHLTYRQKEYLLRDHIPFVVEGKQIYLPFLAVYLQERNDSLRMKTNDMLPSAQILLLHYIYCGCGEMMTSEAARKLAFTPTSISRASRQLEEMGLIRTEKRGVQKIICSEKTPEELFHAAKDSMGSPVKRVIYVPRAELREGMLLSGYSALSEYSMMNPPAVNCIATDSASIWEKTSSEKLLDSDDQCEVELWRYDPKKLASNRCVDRLSLALALDSDPDERVEEAVEEMLEHVWRDIDGQRN